MFVDEFPRASTFPETLTVPKLVDTFAPVTPVTLKVAVAVGLPTPVFNVYEYLITIEVPGYTQ